MRKKVPPPKPPSANFSTHSYPKPPPPKSRRKPPPPPPPSRRKRPKPPFNRVKKSRRITYLMTPEGRLYNRREIEDFFDPESVRRETIAIVKPLVVNLNLSDTTWDLSFVDAIMKYVQQNICYVSDPVGQDYWAPPMDTLSARGGDCDDQALLVASMCLSIGIPARVRIVLDKNGENGHAFAEVLAGTTSSRLVNKYETPLAESNINTFVNKLNSKQRADFVWLQEETQVWLVVDTILCRFVGDMREIKNLDYFSEKGWYDGDVFYSQMNTFNA
jgi:transglutaminase-like putative cysteine protease